MRYCVDTNILVRAAIRDDEPQARAAAKTLREAEIVAVASSALCELQWVLRSVYKLGRADRVAATKTLLASANIVVDRAAADAGLAMLEAGGDFADGMIAHEGAWLGGDTFVSFDKRAVALVAQQGLKAELLVGS